MKMIIHNKSYEIETTKSYNWNTYAKVKVGNQYEQGYVWKRLDDLKMNKFKDPMIIQLYGGYFGLGNILSYIITTDHSGNKEKIDLVGRWRKILARSISKNKASDSNRKFYKDVTISTKWLSYQHFARWVCNLEESNFRPGYQIDKDILGDGSIYSEETCVYIPPYLNKYIASLHRSKSNPFIYVSKSKIDLDSIDECQVYKYATLRLLALAYLKYGMISKKIYKQILNKYIPNDISYNLDKYDFIKRIVFNHVKNEYEIYKPIKSMIYLKPIIFRD